MLNKKHSDNLSLNGPILTINGKDYNLDTLLVIPEKNQQEFLQENRCYIDEKGNKIIQLQVDFFLQFLFINNNYMLFYDKDLNEDLSMDELKEFVRIFNLPETDIEDKDKESDTHGQVIQEGRRTAHKKIIASYSPEEWKAREKAVYNR